MLFLSNVEINKKERNLTKAKYSIHLLRSAKQSELESRDLIWANRELSLMPNDSEFSEMLRTDSILL